MVVVFHCLFITDGGLGLGWEGSLIRAFLAVDLMAALMGVGVVVSVLAERWVCLEFLLLVGEFCGDVGNFLGC